MMQKLLFCILLLLAEKISFSQQPNIDSLIKLTTVAKEDTGTVIAYRMLAGLTVNSNPLKAAAYGKMGALLGKKIGFDKGVAGCILNTAGAYSAAGKLDSALLYIDIAINWSLKVGEPGRLALTYLNRADYNRQLGNMKQALKDCDTSMVYADKANKDDARARIYQTIGSVYHAQDNYVQSKFYYQKGYDLYAKANNKKMMAISMNNLGNADKHLKKYESSLASFQNAIRLAEEIGDENNMSMYYANMSDVYNETGNLKQSEASALQSLKFAKRQEIEVQIATAQIALANIYLKTGNTAAALKLATAAYGIAAKNEMIDESQTAVDELAEAYSKAGNFKEAYKYMKVNKELSDSIARQKFNGDVVTIQTNFKVDEKNKEILLLSKDKQLQQQQIKQQRYLMIGAAAIALLFLFGIWQIINRNRLHLRMKELELRNQIAADLHDEVGSSLSSIHMLSQMATQDGNDARQKDILARMSRNAKETMEKMGDIVWMIKPGETGVDSLKQRMERFAYEICSSKNISVSLHLNELDKIPFVMEQRKNTYLIFKEALNNAVKYSGTEKIAITASLQNNKLILQVKDFGKGFDSSIVKKGNGLDNMKNRAKESGGLFITETSINMGTTIRFVMPLSIS